jgi:arylamine N-acetyltransferase
LRTGVGPTAEPNVLAIDEFCLPYRGKPDSVIEAMRFAAISREDERYLRLLGFAEMPTGLAGLHAIVAAHLERVPFENVSKLLLYAGEGAGRPITLREFLDGIEYRDMGGTCYSSNLFLFELLQALGYDATLLSADMGSPDVHSSICVRLNGVEYHVDVGYAAPFCYPIPLNQPPQTIAAGPARYDVRRVQSRPDSYEVAQFVDGTRRHGYVVHPPARKPEFFRSAILDSYRTDSTFMRCLRISRVVRGEVVDLRNRTLVVSRGESFTTTKLDSVADLRRVMDEVLLMPRCRFEGAIAVLEDLAGVSFFGSERWTDVLD